jgi:triosephosphate isomerase
MKSLIVANWKMNPQGGGDAKKLFTSVQTFAHKLKNVETVICPPMIYVGSLGMLVKNRKYVLGAQDCYFEREGAHTGEISPQMIFNAKARYVIVGHSELRAMGDTNEIIIKKLRAILEYPLIPIICIGEDKRDPKGLFVRAVRKQAREILDEFSETALQRLVFCYEPVWAISSHAQRACTPEECHEMIHAIRQEIADASKSSAVAISVPVLYGGSVNELNTEEFLTKGGASGLLVGRASLEVETMKSILKVAERVSKISE